MANKRIERTHVNRIPLVIKLKRPFLGQDHCLDCFSPSKGFLFNFILKFSKHHIILFDSWCFDAILIISILHAYISSPGSSSFMPSAWESKGLREGFIAMVTLSTSITCVLASSSLALDFIFVGGLLGDKEETTRKAEECTSCYSNFFFLLGSSPLPKKCDSTDKRSN